MRAPYLAAAAILLAGAVPGRAANVPLQRVTAVRHWSLDGVTRIVIEVTGGFQYHSERLHNPERVFFDVFRAQPDLDGKRFYTREVGDKLVQRVRVAETLPGVSRVVLDLAAPVDYTASQISNPDRLVVELRPAAAPAETTAVPAAAAPAAQETPTAPAEPPVAAAAPPAAPPPPAPVKPPAPARPATRATDGGSSLTRALGLKLRRVVIDPGHGGHDQGTVGRRGLVEKDLVLDIAQRLGPLIEQRLGCEVAYTRTEDVFVPLERRTEIANELRADLFVSLHANSSRYSGIAGVETFYLNFTTSRDALDVAARENASSEKSISELQDVLQKIARQEKIEESKDLAGRVQTAMFRFASRYHRGLRDRGVKKAPFVVLLGAKMPSVLVEIGFLSNAREEALLKRSDHRQRVAEALLKGVSEYANSLSHFQLASTGE